jgi:hypothetical protein
MAAVMLCQAFRKPGWSPTINALRTRRSAVAARLQTAALARRCGTLHAAPALPWSATVVSGSSGTGCLPSLATSQLSKRLRPQHPLAAIRKATVIDHHAAPQSRKRNRHERRERTSASPERQSPAGGRAGRVQRRRSARAWLDAPGDPWSPKESPRLDRPDRESSRPEMDCAGLRDTCGLVLLYRTAPILSAVTVINWPSLQLARRSRTRHARSGSRPAGPARPAPARQQAEHLTTPVRRAHQHRRLRAVGSRSCRPSFRREDRPVVHRCGQVLRAYHVVCLREWHRMRRAKI